MVIQTFEKGYTVISYVEFSQKRDIFICKDDKENKECTIVQIKDNSMIAGIMEFLCDEVNNKAFTDFVECFVSGNQLHIVFQYHKGDTLESKINQQVSSLKERLEIAKNILEKMVLYNMSYYFQYICLHKNKILVSASLEVNFNYIPNDLENYRLYTMRHVMAAVLELLKFLFKEELNNKMIEPLSAYIKLVDENTFDSYLEMYTRFCETCLIIEELPADEIKTPKSWMFRLWGKVKKLFKPMRKIIAAVLLIVAFVYMILVIGQSFNTQTEQKKFDYIGTVVIE